MGSRRKSVVPDGSFWVAEKPHRPVFTDPSGKKYRELSESYYVTVEMLSDKLDENVFSEKATRAIHQLVPRTGQFYPRGCFASLHKATPHHIEFFNRMFAKIQSAIEQSYQNGKNSGRGLLTQLAAGEITVRQLNDNSVDANRES